MPLQLSLLLCNRSRKTYQNLSVQESHQEENAKIDAIRRLFPLSPSTPPGDANNPPRENETSRQCSNHRLADHDKLQRFQVTNDLIFKNKSILVAVTSRLLFPKTLLKNHPKKQYLYFYKTATPKHLLSTGRFSPSFDGTFLTVPTVPTCAGFFKT